MADRLRAGLTPTDEVCTLRGADVHRILKAEFGMVGSLSAVYHLLHALGIEPLRPPGPASRRRRPRPRRRSKTLPGRVAEVVAARPGERVVEWFEDEARFGRAEGVIPSCVDP